MRRPRALLVTSGALLPFLLITACSSGEPSPSNQEQDDDSASSQKPAVETSGGVELPRHKALQGTVTVVGSSAAVPVSNRSFTGHRNPALNGEELVRCNFYPDGNDKRPHVEILAGFEGREYYQVQAQIFQFSEEEPIELPLSVNDKLEDGSQELIVIASLTHDSEVNAYRYWYTVDQNAFEPYGSSCTATIETLEDGKLVGSLQCDNLLALPSSPDFPITNAPNATAQVSIQFDCPLMLRDPRGAEILEETEGYCSGFASTCYFLDRYECSETPGCTPSSSCEGLAPSCYSQTGPFTCAGIAGCSWDDYFDQCVGSARRCDTFTNDFECILHQGCDWREDCDGEATHCSAFVSEAGCSAQGCNWED